MLFIVMGFLLLILSSVLKMVLGPFLYIYGAITSWGRCENDAWNKELAKAKDQYGNALGKYIFNDVLITKYSVHKFGNIDETISSVIGKNKKAGTLTKAGKALDWILDNLDENHSIKAIDHTE